MPTPALADTGTATHTRSLGLVPIVTGSVFNGPFTAPDDGPADVGPGPVNGNMAPDGLGGATVAVGPTTVTGLKVSNTLLVSLDTSAVPILTPSVAGTTVVVRAETTGRPGLHRGKLTSTSQIDFYVPTGKTSALQWTDTVSTCAANDRAGDVTGDRDGRGSVSPVSTNTGRQGGGDNDGTTVGWRT